MDVQQLFNTVARELEKRSEELVDVVLNAPEAEVLVKTATNNDQWGPSGTEMLKISQLTNNGTNFRIVMDALWARIFEKREGKNWRNVYKGLLLLDYLLKNGSDGVATEARFRVYELKQLVTGFRYIDSTGVDRGLSVVERTKQIVDLVHDTERLKEERATARRNRGKFQGMSSEGVGHFSSQEHFRKTDPYYGQDPSTRGFDNSDEFNPYGGTGSTAPRKNSSGAKKSRGGKSKNMFSSSSSEDSDKQSAIRQVPQKEAWKPFGQAPQQQQRQQQPQQQSQQLDDDWGDFEFSGAATTHTPAPVVHTTSSPIMAVGGSSSAVSASASAPTLLLLTPTNSAQAPVVTTQQHNYQPPQQQGGDPWAAFSFAQTPSTNSNNNLGFGSATAYGGSSYGAGGLGYGGGVGTTGNVGYGYGAPPTGY